MKQIYTSFLLLLTLFMATTPTVHALEGETLEELRAVQLYSQDALIGNKAYDLASLIDDVRFQTSVTLKNKIYNFYLKTQKKLNKKYFKNDFEIISVLRNLKIIGIFTRLAVRDNKKKYLQLIPYTWRLIKLRSQSDNFRDLNYLLKVSEVKKTIKNVATDVEHKFSKQT